MNNLIDGLKVFLASNFVLYLNTHSAHWNVVGPNFYEMHKMLDEQYNDLWDNVDTIAEKIRQLDSFITMTPGEQIKFSVIESIQEPMEAQSYAAILMRDHDRMIRLLNIVFKLAEAENNQAIMNYIAERLDAHAKMRWFLKSTISNIIK